MVRWFVLLVCLCGGLWAGPREQALAERCARFVHSKITYKTDLAQWGVKNYYQSPEISAYLATGDCEDYCIAAGQLLWVVFGIDSELCLLEAEHAVLRVDGVYYDPTIGQYGEKYPSSRIIQVIPRSSFSFYYGEVLDASIEPWIPLYSRVPRLPSEVLLPSNRETRTRKESTSLTIRRSRSRRDR